MTILRVTIELGFIDVDIKTFFHFLYLKKKTFLDIYIS